MKRLPIKGFIALKSSRRIIKVQVQRSYGVYPFLVSSLEKGVQYTDKIADPLFIILYKTRRKAEKAELEVLHQEYRNVKRILRKMEKAVKLANLRVAEFKAFKQVQTIV